MHVAGQHSWFALAPFVALVVARLISSQRRRQTGPRQHRSSTAGFTASSGERTAAPQGSGSGEPTYVGTAPGWFTDPFVRHEKRYWSGTAWTEHVLDGDAPAVDPPPPSSS